MGVLASGSAHISGRACVDGRACVGGGAHIAGRACVDGRACVGGSGHISGMTFVSCSDASQKSANRNVPSLCNTDLRERPGDRCANLQRNLVGLQFHDRLVLPYVVSELLAPSSDSSFGNRLAQRRNQ